jgi:hypothetical protein
MRWLACREIACCDRTLLPQSFENDDICQACAKSAEPGKICDSKLGQPGGAWYTRIEDRLRKGHYKA